MRTAQAGSGQKFVSIAVYYTAEYALDEWGYGPFDWSAAGAAGITTEPNSTGYSCLKMPLDAGALVPGTKATGALLFEVPDQIATPHGHCHDIASGETRSWVIY